MTKWRRKGSGNRNCKLPARLRCSVQNYEWGIQGQDSRVVRIFSLNSGSAVDPLKPYAELWIGTQESGPSFFVDRDRDGNGLGLDSMSLESWISRNPNELGDKVLNKRGADLPFLFKLLSVQNALSIQVHPDKERATALHNSQPNVCKDDNYKPEMAIAITELEALCGFISMKDKDQEAKLVLKHIFSKLLLSNKEKISEAISKLKRRLLSDRKKRLLTDKEQLVLRLERQYSADTGIFSSLSSKSCEAEPW